MGPIGPLKCESCRSPLFLHLGLSYVPRFGRQSADYDDYPTVRAAAGSSNHQPTRAVDKEKNEAELSVNIKKATSAEETAPSELLLP